MYRRLIFVLMELFFLKEALKVDFLRDPSFVVVRARVLHYRGLHLSSWTGLNNQPIASDMNHIVIVYENLGFRLSRLRGLVWLEQGIL